MFKKKQLGQVYTPVWIVNEILDLVNYKGQHVIGKYILEPSCGDGAFLQEIVRRYIKAAKEIHLNNNEIISHLETYIWGVEIDEIAYEGCIDNLNNIIYEELLHKKINWQIFQANTLILYKDYLSKFDFIVGNPPYIRIHNLDLYTRELLKSNFHFTDGTIDIYLVFFEMGFKMLKNNGLLGFITPNSYLHNSSYKRFRNYLKTNKMVQTLIDFKANKIFKGISTYTAISVFQNNYSTNTFVYKELKNNQITFVNNIYFDKLSDNDWSFSTEENARFLTQLSTERPSAIKDFFDVQYGFATLRDKIFIGRITSEEANNLVIFNGHLIEKNILKTVVKGSRFKGNIDKNDKIIFPYEFVNGRYSVLSEQKLADMFPHCYRYFLSKRAELESRDIDKKALWYEYGRSQGVQSIHNEKIVMSTLLYNEVKFYHLPKEVLMYSGIFIVKKTPYSDWAILEEALQSEEFFKYIRLTGKDFSGGYKSITSKQIKDFKINCKNPQILF